MLQNFRYTQHVYSRKSALPSTDQLEALADLFSVNGERPDRRRQTRQDHLLALPRVCTEAGKRRFAYRIARQLNMLPPNYSIMSVGRFRRTLKTKLLASDHVTLSVRRRVADAAPRRHMIICLVRFRCVCVCVYVFVCVFLVPF